VEIWLLQSAVAYSDYGGHRLITQHTFSDFQLFSVHTQEVIQKPYVSALDVTTALFCLVDCA
jgi:hypothetical protein